MKWGHLGKDWPRWDRYAEKHTGRVAKVKVNPLGDTPAEVGTDLPFYNA